ncbi:HNH endonuclease [Microbacterium sp. gxy059]|uniref:HNH endonuclease n=1 Tax=Microbacterium sp. gxy059 TaxID=2957199 RepID=UPI003D96602A
MTVTIPLDELHRSDGGAGATIAGSPVDPDSARLIAGLTSGWDRALIDPTTGNVLATDRYRPTAEQKRFLTTRDGGCRFSGCSITADRCDIDHTIDYAHGGPTATNNLAHLCEAHHVMKHHSEWTVTKLPDGLLEWTSPAGRVYTDTPPARITFRDPAAPPRMSDDEIESKAALCTDHDASIEPDAHRDTLGDLILAGVITDPDPPT